MIKSLTLALLGLSVALPAFAQEAQFRMTLDAPILFGTGTSLPETPIPAEVVIDVDALFNRRAGASLSIPVSATGMAAGDTISIVDAPSDLQWVQATASSGAATGSLLAPQGDYLMRARVLAANGDVKKSETVSIRIRDAFEVVDLPPSYSFDVGDAVSIAPVASNAFDGVEWSLQAPQDLPEWLAFDATTGRLTGIAAEFDETAFVIRGTDEIDDAHDDEGFTLAVTSAPQCSIVNGTLDTTQNWTHVAYSNQRFATIGGMQAASSSDGLSWVKNQISTSGWSDIEARGDTGFVASSGNGSTTDLNRFASSADGQAWTVGSIANPSVGAGWHYVAHGNGVSMLFTAATRQYARSNGAGWDISTGSWPNLNDVEFVNGRFFILHSGTTIRSSADGVTWTPHTVPSGTWYTMTHGAGRYVAVALNGTNRMMTSTDGEAWEAVALSGASAWRGVAHGDGVFVAVANSGDKKALVSKNGSDWFDLALPADSTWTGVAYGNGKFVAVANGGSVRSVTIDCQ